MSAPSKSNLATVNSVIGKPYQIWSGGSGVKPFIFNNDTANTLYIGSKQEVLKQDTSSTIPVPPIAGQVWPDVDIWAFAPVPLNYLIIPGAESFAPSPVQVQLALNAAGIATAANQQSQLTTGAPLTTGESVLFNQANQTIAQGASFTLQAQVTRPGYLIVLRLWNVTNNADQMPVTVDVQFSNSNAFSGNILSHETWRVFAGTAASKHLINGSGPCEGTTMTIKVTNNVVPNDTLGLDIAILMTTATFAEHIWQTDDTAFVIPANTVANSDLNSNILGSTVATSIAGSGGSLLRLLPLYAGQCGLQALTASGAADLFVTITAVGEQLTPTAGTIVYNKNTDASGKLQQTGIWLPRSQCTIQLLNNSAAAQACSFSLIPSGVI